MAMIASLATDDTLSDGVDWQVDIDLVDSETKQPLDLTGSELRCTFCAMVDGENVADAMSGGSDPMITTIGSPSAGKIRILVPYAGRAWRAPRFGQLRLMQPTTVVGDLIRRSDPNEPLRLEDQARIILKVRPSTTQWLPSP